MLFRVMRLMPALCLLLLSACTIWREHNVTAWKDATGGEGLERSFWQEMKTQNWKELEKHVAANYVLIAPEGGRLDRAAALQHLKQLKIEEYSLGDVQTELNGNTIVVSYSIALKGSASGNPLPPTPVRMMTVWQQQKAGWMAIAHSVIGSIDHQ